MIFWNVRDNFENKVERAIWHYLKQLVFTSVNIFENNVSKAFTLIVFETIWNCNETNENNVAKVCILKVFKTIWNCREHFKNIFFKACALKVFETIWNCREIDEHNVHLKHTFWRIWNDLELQKNNWKHVSKACFIAVFETIWNCRKKDENMKTRTLTRAIRHVLIRYFDFQRKSWDFWDLCSTTFRGSDSAIQPTTPFNFITNLDVFFFSFFEMKCRLRW